VTAEARLKALEEAAAERERAREQEEREMQALTAARNTAAVRLQSTWRRYAAMTLTDKRMRGIIAIQSLYRGRLQRQRIHHWKRTATVIQSIWRGCRTQASFIAVKKAALCVEACWRRRASRKSTHLQSNASTAIAHWWRLHRCRIQQRECYLMLLRRIVDTQRVIRGHLLRNKMTQLRRRYLTCLITVTTHAFFLISKPHHHINTFFSFFYLVFFPFTIQCHRSAVIHSLQAGPQSLPPSTLLHPNDPVCLESNTPTTGFHCRS
jgi:hypothetical protein